MARSSNRTADDRKSTSYKVSASLHKELKIAAAHDGRDMSELLEEALRTYLSKRRVTKLGNSMR